jgi:undecaprenyl diphosphate synthase
MSTPRGPVPSAFIDLDLNRMPGHVAIIMDGNGRWAQRQGKLRVFGHRAGMERIVQIVRTSSDIGLTALTLFAFSTENWKRPRPEVEALFGLLVEYIRREIANLHQNNVRLRIIGDPSLLPMAAQQEVQRGCEMTKNNSGLMLNIALNYGGRAEIIRAVQQIAEDVASGKCSPMQVDAAMFESKLDTAGMPDPDLLIRTSGEIRISNFLLYQIAYAEFCVCDALWPDFDNIEYAKCIRDYVARERRFGSIEGDPLC